MDEPIPVIPLEYARPESNRDLRWGRYLVRFALIAWGGALAATIAIFIDVESVLISGPALTILGAIIIVAAFRARRPAAAIAGYAHISVCLLFFILINLLSWRPVDARTPFMTMAPTYTAFAAWPALNIWRGRW